MLSRVEHWLDNAENDLTGKDDNTIDPKWAAADMAWAINEWLNERVDDDNVPKTRARAFMRELAEQVVSMSNEWQVR